MHSSDAHSLTKKNVGHGTGGEGGKLFSILLGEHTIYSLMCLQCYLLVLQCDLMSLLVLNYFLYWENR